MPATKESNPFTGRIGEEYGFLAIICPNVATLIRNLGAAVAAWKPDVPLRGLEIGCGTGLSTLSLVSQCENLHLRAFDASPAMLKQARDNLSDYVAAGRAELIESDALDFLRRQPDASVDVVASNYTIHNFANDYREQVFAEILRVLAPGGLFANGDRFAHDDRARHLASTQAEVRRWFDAFARANRLDLLQDWIVHLLSDESPDHIMYRTPTLSTLRSLGFADVRSIYSENVDMLVTATKH
jgi:ubiquinone/menaquinone biosynthesis C-methylase UbiE